ncbi:MAG: phosphotransferase, partial [Candidatus Sumerlaeaceae bacterium]|nr:phosphotransferase [Candidatus Sumerlaeaceae bacterium]
KELIPLLGLDEKSPVKIELAFGGARSLVRFATIADRKFALRAYPVSRRAEAISHRDASALLSCHGILVPTILHYFDNPRNYGAVFLVEEFVDGIEKSGDALQPDDIRQIATELARLHSIHSSQWGPFDALRSGEMGTTLFTRIKRQISQLRRAGALTGSQDAVKLIDWFQHWVPALNSLPHYSLTHGKIRPGNGLFLPDGRFCLLDTATLEWGIGARDVAKLFRKVFLDDKAKAEFFLAAYLPGLEDSDRTLFHHFQTFFELHTSVTDLAMKSERLDRYSHEWDATRLPDVQEQIANLLKSLPNLPV